MSDSGSNSGSRSTKISSSELTVVAVSGFQVSSSDDSQITWEGIDLAFLDVGFDLVELADRKITDH